MKELKRDLTLLLDKGAQIDAVNEAALRAKLIQISVGVVYDAEHVAHPVDAAPRLARPLGRMRPPRRRVRHVCLLVPRRRAALRPPRRLVPRQR